MLSTQRRLAVSYAPPRCGNADQRVSAVTVVGCCAPLCGRDPLWPSRGITSPSSLRVPQHASSSNFDAAELLAMPSKSSFASSASSSSLRTHCCKAARLSFDSLVRASLSRGARGRSMPWLTAWRSAASLASSVVPTQFKLLQPKGGCSAARPIAFAARTRQRAMPSTER